MKHIFTFLFVLIFAFSFGQEIIKDSTLGNGVNLLTTKFDENIRFDFYYPEGIKFSIENNRITGNYQGVTISMEYNPKNTYTKEWAKHHLESEGCRAFNANCQILENGFLKRTLEKEDDILNYYGVYLLFMDQGAFHVFWSAQIPRSEKVLENVNDIDVLADILMRESKLMENYYYFYE